MFVVTFNVKFMVHLKLWSMVGKGFQQLVIHAQF